MWVWLWVWGSVCYHFFTFIADVTGHQRIFFLHKERKWKAKKKFSNLLNQLQPNNPKIRLSNSVPQREKELMYNPVREFRVGEREGGGGREGRGKEGKRKKERKKVGEKGINRNSRGTTKGGIFHIIQRKCEFLIIGSCGKRGERRKRVEEGFECVHFFTRRILSLSLPAHSGFPHPFVSGSSLSNKSTSYISLSSGRQQLVI